MKKVLRVLYTLIGIVCLGVIMISTDFNQMQTSAQAEKLKKLHCFGYTVVEAGKGIDCYGDTVKLVKSNGYYQLVTSLNKKIKSDLLN